MGSRANWSLVFLTWSVCCRGWIDSESANLSCPVKSKQASWTQACCEQSFIPRLEMNTAFQSVHKCSDSDGVTGVFLC